MKKLLFAIALLMPLIANAQFHDVADVSPNIPEGIRIISTQDTVQIQPIKYFKQKFGSGAFAAGLTYGIAKTKTKNFYKGKFSPNKAKVGDTIRFCFGEIPPQYISNNYMFQEQYSIRNFSLCRFETKKDRRELTTGEVSVWSGADTGVKENHDIEFEVKTVAPGIYDAIITKAEPGEYCFVFTDNGIGAYTSVFDFSVVKE